ncbi:Retrovirus-related Pol polyprotein from transposon [Sesamum angolense]|uniref:Retrovirus-related Pol polyprotein from transposon n=1 Tax=Sesamum angolense TaxID=2727404 RepID=A0AAE1WBP8_9LAMI|nr:Retrovirus-related Pol polyprotein from transposon [Sesamum angolense]
MVDTTIGHEALSFIDGSSGYNEIRMSPKDEECTTFRTPKGIYCCKVMPFGLKNAGATYQCAMQNIFDDVLHKKVECYVDDLVVKTKKRGEHLADLQIVFDCLRNYNLKMNLPKCAFGVSFEKFLGFIVRHRVKFVMSRPILSERLAKWSIVFNQYEINYVFQKAVKGQALANFLADHPMPIEWEMSDDFPDDDILSIEILLAWTMLFDGVA